MDITFAGEGDVSALMRLSRVFFEELHPAMPRQLAQYIEAEDEEYWYALIVEKDGFIACAKDENGSILGMAICKISDSCDLESLYVLPKERRRGIGSKLIRYSMQMAKLKGCSMMRLCLSGYKESLRLLYEKNGFAGNDMVMYAVL